MAIAWVALGCCCWPSSCAISRSSRLRCGRGLRVRGGRGLARALVVQVLLAVVVATIGIVLVRPLMSNALARSGEGHPARGVHGTLVGEEVLTLDEVGDAHHAGHVRLAGERWLAVSGSDAPIPPETRVLVTGVQGTTLVVWPVDGPAALSQPPIDPSES